MYSTNFWLDCLFFFSTYTYRLYSQQPNQLQKAKPSNIMKHFTTYQSALTHTSWWRHLLACYCWIVKVWQEYLLCWRYVSLLIGTTAAAVSRARGREAKSSQSPTDWENQFCVSGCHNRHLDSPALCVRVSQQTSGQLCVSVCLESPALCLCRGQDGGEGRGRAQPREECCNTARCRGLCRWAPPGSPAVIRLIYTALYIVLQVV